MNMKVRQETEKIWRERVKRVMEIARKHGHETYNFEFWYKDVPSSVLCLILELDEQIGEW